MMQCGHWEIQQSQLDDGDPIFASPSASRSSNLQLYFPFYLQDLRNSIDTSASLETKILLLLSVSCVLMCALLLWLLGDCATYLYLPSPYVRSGIPEGHRPVRAQRQANQIC